MSCTAWGWTGNDNQGPKGLQSRECQAAEGSLQVSELLTAPVISPGVGGEEPPAASALGGVCG